MEGVLLIQTVVIVLCAWLALSVLAVGLWVYAKWLSKN